MARPSRQVDASDLITLDEAVELIAEFWQGKVHYTRRTLQNHISAKKLKRYGPYKETLVSRIEIMNKYCQVKAS